MNSLHGVVLAGGQSRRMGRDKAFLSYDGETAEAERVAALLREFCQSVEIACRPEQIETWKVLLSTPLRKDEYPAFGPLAGILTALEAYPQNAVLAVACDLPFLNRETLTHLIENRREGDWASVFVQEGGMVEPLCAIYEPSARDILLAHMNLTGRTSLWEALDKTGVRRLALSSQEAMMNVNSPDEYQRAKALMKLPGGGSAQAPL